MMADLLGMGAAWLERQRQRFCTHAVRYRRGSQELVVPATLGKTIFRVDLGMGVIERIEARDYLIAADALGAFGLPQRGDRIAEDLPTLAHPARVQSIAEVLAPGREPHWRWVDATRLAYRIHTKHLSTEPIP